MEENGRCQAVAAAIGEDGTATAPHAVSWVGVAGPRLDLPHAVSEVFRGSGVAVVAVRPLTPPSDAGGRPTPPVGMILAGTLPGATWRRDVAPDDVPTVLARLRSDPSLLPLLASGRDPRLGRTSHRRAVLVCADDRSDGCCGRYGPAAALAVLQAVGGPAPRGWLTRQGLGRSVGTDVLECGDIGGHRFAPTVVVLPWGMVLGGLGPDPAALVAAVTDVLAGRPLVDGYRGRSTYPPHVQAAEAAARRHLAMLGTNAGPDDLVVHGADRVDSRVAAPVGSLPSQRWNEEGDVGADVADLANGESHVVRLRHVGGRTIRVMVSRVRTDVMRPLSCGAAPATVDVWETGVEADPPTGLWL